MSRLLHKHDNRNMDSCLRRLKQELLSMKEVGDGLHAQMNSMMGALQELKLLQVQTAIDNLDISGRPINRRLPKPSCTPAASEQTSCSRPTMPAESRPSTRGSLATSSNDASHSRSSLGTTSSSASSLKAEGLERSARSESDLEAIPKRWSGYLAPQVDFYGPVVGVPPPEPHPQQHTQVMDLPGILYSLSKEGPSLDSDYSQDSADDGSDWTSSLMSQSRNRQPLVLGDNIFADLVGNWLDLPEVEREEFEEERMERKDERTMTEGRDSPSHPLRMSRSQEICRKFSLTTNIFKKFLRSVRPDRDKLLKERPGWMAPEETESDLFKRPKKLAQKSSKGSFYLPFWANGQQSKARQCPNTPEPEKSQQPFHHYHQQPFKGVYLDRRPPDTRLEKTHPLFDCNTAVWV
ncbi:PAK4-inhibitor INKA2 [Synchiropus splendidus]|uniref:PAK4-inhibitor INKA2 n=1 Tax=Synchiropus splendidus TaxID=270530 RepID=UPI00237E0E60|nr:PAK4-inhibitor INKA2 [Synchiropus splendidus]